MKDRELKHNLTALLLRFAIFAAAVAMYALDGDMLRFGDGVGFFADKPWLLVLWAALLGQLVFHFFSNARKRQRGAARSGLRPPERAEVHKANVGALKVAVLWIVCNAVIAVLYYLRIIGRGELLLLTLFYFVCDLIAVMFFCPFSKFIMHNKCCMTCRIYDWGAIMAYTPMLIVPSFFSWTLAGAAVVIFVRWEVVYATRGELFFETSCDTLSCAKCPDPLCGIKRRSARNGDATAAEDSEGQIHNT